MTFKHTTRIAGAIIGSVAVIGALAACSDDEATDAQETSQVQSSDSMQSDAAEPTTPEAEQGQPMTGLPLAATAGNDVSEADISPAIAEAAAAYMGPGDSGRCLRRCQGAQWRNRSAVRKRHLC